jgi:hypothetical protein
MSAGQMFTDNAGVTINFFNKPVLVSLDIKCHPVVGEHCSAWVALIKIIAVTAFSLPGIRMSGINRFFNIMVFTPECYQDIFYDDMYGLTLL